MKVEVEEVGLDEFGNDTLAFVYKGKNYMGICSDTEGQSEA